MGKSDHVLCVDTYESVLTGDRLRYLYDIAYHYIIVPNK